MKLIHLLLLALPLAGCGSIPTAGPFATLLMQTAIEIDPPVTDGDDDGTTSVALLTVQSSNLGLANLRGEAVTGAWPAIGDPGKLRINIGDTLAVTIYEEKAGGLFIPEQAGVRPGNFISLPDQPVDASGNILVPYVGVVRVVGKTPYEVSRNIVAQLANRAINPQVVVSYSARGGAEVSVLGEVNAAQRHALSFEGERVLDAIAKAGGPRFPVYETYVTLHRAGMEYTLSLDELVLNPTKNVFLEPGDTLVLYRETSFFTAFGAVTRGGAYDFGKRSLSLSEALGKAFGLDALRANAGEVYVFREVAKEKLLTAMGERSRREAVLTTFHEQVPLVLRFNLRQPGGYHLAQHFPMQSKDIIFVPDADTINLNKFLAVILPTTESAVNIQRLD